MFINRISREVCEGLCDEKSLFENIERKTSNNLYSCRWMRPDPALTADYFMNTEDGRKLAEMAIEINCI